LCAGYAMLVLAPGQAERYAGRAGRLDPLGLIASRGLAGCYDIVAGFIAEAQWAISGTAAAVLAFVAAHRRRGAVAPVPSRAALRAIAWLAGAALAIVVLLFGSPVAVERLLFASAVLLAGALAVALDHVLGHAGGAPRLRAVIVAACAVIAGYHAVRFTQVSIAVAGEQRQRMAALRAAAPGTIARVPAYRTPRSRWLWGDDFRMAAVRDQVARGLFGLAGVELEPRPIWAEPAPSERFVGRADYAPPLTAPLPAELAAPPPFLDAALAQLRRALALGAGAIDGHRLIRYEIAAEAPGFVDPAHRPLRALVWTPGSIAFVHGDGEEDADGEPAIRVSGSTLPAGWSDAFVIGCGETRRVAARDDRGDAVLPVELACRGSYTAVICDPAACWFAGRYWR